MTLKLLLGLAISIALVSCSQDDGGAGTQGANGAGASGGADGAGASEGAGASMGNGLSPYDLKIAVIPVLFSDQSETDVPTIAEIRAQLDSSDMRQLFQDSSYGEATYSVEVAPWQGVPATQVETVGDDVAVSEQELASIDVSLPGVSGDTHFIVFFAVFDTSVTNGLAGSWTIYDYGGGEDPRPTLNGELVPHMMLLTHDKDSLDEIRSYGVARFDPRTEKHSWHDGEVLGEGRPISNLQSTYAHEMVHYLGLGTHANSWEKGERFFFEPADGDEELREEYGNQFALLGQAGALTPIMHSVYRHFAGWGHNLIEEMAPGEDRRVTIAPLNRRKGKTSVRFETDPVTGNGIYLELREDDGWHDFVRDTPLLAGNLEGIMIVVRDGNTIAPTSFIVDASPMPRANDLFPGQDISAFSDLVLKPGMEMHMPQMSLTDVQGEADAHMSVRIQTFETPREILYRPVRPSFTKAGDTATVTWDGSTHADTTGFEVEVIAADKTTVSTTVSGAGATTADLDISTLAAAGELHARVRAVGGGHPANWSRDTYVVPAP